MRSTAELLETPSAEQAAEALALFASKLHATYGSDLVGVFLFGSRARGDNRPDSDADVAVILANEGWRFWDEKDRLLDLSYDFQIDYGLYIQPWPFTKGDWINPGGSTQAGLIAAAKRDGRSIGDAP